MENSKLFIATDLKKNSTFEGIAYITDSSDIIELDNLTTINDYIRRRSFFEIYFSNNMIFREIKELCKDKNISTVYTWDNYFKYWQNWEINP